MATVSSTHDDTYLKGVTHCDEPSERSSHRVLVSFTSFFGVLTQRFGLFPATNSQTEKVCKLAGEQSAAFSSFKGDIIRRKWCRWSYSKGSDGLHIHKHDD